MSDEENEEIQSCKVVLIGESGVGKTCITNRFIKEVFNANEIPTSSASFAQKILKFDNYGKKIKFDIWDTAGQERFRSIGKIFYNDANAVILVYDITNEKSFEEIKKYWYKEILESCPKNINKYLF